MSRNKFEIDIYGKCGREHCEFILPRVAPGVPELVHPDPVPVELARKDLQGGEEPVNLLLVLIFKQVFSFSFLEGGKHKQSIRTTISTG